MATEHSFLGSGWAFPPTFSSGGEDVMIVSGIEDIHQSLQILLSTRPGERTLQDDFGCNLEDILFEEINQGLVNTLTGLVSNAILYHEPRIIMESLDIQESANEPGLLLISIDYTVRATNTRFNMVYPFYINEATFPGNVG